MTVLFFPKALCTLKYGQMNIVWYNFEQHFFEDFDGLNTS